MSVGSVQKRSLHLWHNPLVRRFQIPLVFAVGLAVVAAGVVVVGCSAHEAAVGCASPNPIKVVQAFVLAAEGHDAATLAKCTFDGGPLSNDAVAKVATGGWLLDKATITTQRIQTDAALAPTAVVYNVPLTPSQGAPTKIGGSILGDGPSQQAGANIVIDKKPDGLYYIVEVDFYFSS